MKLFAIDASGSVSSEKAYWDIVRTLFNQLPPDRESWTFVAWGDSARRYTYTETKFHLFAGKDREMPTRGGTVPSTIFNDVAPQTRIEDFVFITDGEIHQSCVDTFETMLQSRAYTFDRVQCHIIGKRESKNMSTVCVFHRHPNVCTKLYNTTNPVPDVQTIKTPTSEEFALLQTLDRITLADFQAHYDQLYSVLVSMFMGRDGNPDIHAQLVAAQKRLTLELKNAETAKHRDLLQTLTVDTAQQLIDEYYQGGAVAVFAANMDRLISLASKGLRGQFASKLFDVHHARNASVATPASWAPAEDEVDEPLEDDLPPPFECPILNTATSPVLLIAEGEPILHQLPKPLVDAIRRNPLSCIGNPEIEARLHARILPYMIGEDAVRTLQTHGRFVDPYTRRAVVGYLPLDPIHLSMTNFNLALLFGNTKMLGNPDLFFIALYFIIHSAGADQCWIRNEDWDAVMRCWELQLDHRMLHSTTTISLCGLPNFLVHKVPLYRAIWFVLASGVLRFPDESVRPLRAHCFTTTHLRKLHARSVSYGWAPPLTNDMQHMIDATYVTLKFLHDCKTVDRWDSLRETLLCPWMELDGWVFRVEGFPGDFYTLHPYFQTINRALITPWRRELFVAYANMVHKNLSASSLTIDWVQSLVAADGIRPLANQQHYWFRPSSLDLIPAADRDAGYQTWCRVPMCPATCRPYAEETIAGVSYPWRDVLQLKFHFAQDSRPYLSLHEWLGRYIVQHVAYPSERQYWQYVQARLHRRNEPMPRNIHALWNDLMLDYQSIFASIPPKEFARRFRNSTTLVKRKYLERNK